MHPALRAAPVAHPEQPFETDRAYAHKQEGGVHGLVGGEWGEMSENDLIQIVDVDASGSGGSEGGAHGFWENDQGGKLGRKEVLQETIFAGKIRKKKEGDAIRDIFTKKGELL